MCIRSRAIRRAGELLKQFDGRGNNQHSNGTDTKQTQSQIAQEAGISKRQQTTAVRIANVDGQELETELLLRSKMG